MTGVQTVLFRSLIAPFLRVFIGLFAAWAFLGNSTLFSQEKTVPIFIDGESQVVLGFSEPADWIRHDLWVETEFDSDADGKLDRMHVDVTRPIQTDTEGLMLPVIYESSPYFAGTGSADPKHFWNPRHALGIEPPKHEDPPAFNAKGKRPIISNSQTKQWVPRGFAVVHSSSPGTGLSQGCPTDRKSVV